MKVVCSYCRKEMAEKEPFDDDRISHSICPECFDYFQEQWHGLALEKYLDRFEAPILIMDGDCRIVAANERAEALMGKTWQQAMGLLGGDAMECAYARLPGGCGKTVHCATCTLRKTVEDVMASGKPKKSVSVTVTQVDRKVRLVISSEKIGELVCIYVEEGEPQGAGRT